MHLQRFLGVAAFTSLVACNADLAGFYEDGGDDGFSSGNGVADSCGQLQEEADLNGCQSPMGTTCDAEMNRRARCYLDNSNDICFISSFEQGQINDCLQPDPSSSSSSGSGGVDSCDPATTPCQAQTCCLGASCIAFEGSVTECAAACAFEGDECPEGRCCAATTEGSFICAPSQFCN